MRNFFAKYYPSTYAENAVLAAESREIEAGTRLGWVAWDAAEANCAGDDPIELKEETTVIGFSPITVTPGYMYLARAGYVRGSADGGDEPEVEIRVGDAVGRAGVNEGIILGWGPKARVPDRVRIRITWCAQGAGEETRGTGGRVMEKEVMIY